MKSKFLTISFLVGGLVGGSMAEAADIVDTVAATPNLSTLSAMIRDAGIAETLKGKGPFTLFAPTDDAFSRLSANTIAGWKKPENRDQLAKMLTLHVLPSKVTEKDMSGKHYKSKTVNGTEVDIDADDPGEGIRVNKAKVTKADVSADNGVIHVVNRVVMP